MTADPLSIILAMVMAAGVVAGCQLLWVTLNNAVQDAREWLFTSAFLRLVLIIVCIWAFAQTCEFIAAHRYDGPAATTQHSKL